MNYLVKKVNELRASELRKLVERRIRDFKALNKKGNKEWFSELCYCLLTAKTSAEMGMRVQKELGYKGFIQYNNESELARRLKNSGYWYYNKRAEFIHLANQYRNIKDILEKEDSKREWLIRNIKGFGYKEASHFLRNVGFFDYAIIDKHILRVLNENNLIDRIPNFLTKKRYLGYERILGKLADKVNLSQGELDLYLWSMKTGKVLK